MKPRKWKNQKTKEIVKRCLKWPIFADPKAREDLSGFCKAVRLIARLEMPLFWSERVRERVIRQVTNTLMRTQWCK